MSLSINLVNIKLESCLMNASGALCTTYDELKDLSQSQSGVIVSKSCSYVERKGNPKPRYYHSDNFSINSMGLANLGYNFYLSSAKYLNSNQKPFMMSIATLDDEYTFQILDSALKSPHIAMIEINISCPNICNTDTILAYHFTDLDNYLTKMKPYLDKNENSKPIGVKLPPYWEPYQFKEMSKLIVKYGFNFITLVNSVPNCLVIDTDTDSPVIKPKNGIGGLGGSYIKPVVLSNISQFYRLLPKEIQIIGCGGVETGEDVYHHLLAGASCVQIGTSLMKHGTNIFEAVGNELKTIMKMKGYDSIGQIVGHLKYNTPMQDGY